MTTERVTRKLAAVLHADVRGYSRLMREDEVATVRALNAYRELMGKIVELHRGRVVDMSGDAFLIEFPSVVDAVSCAVEFQREVTIRNADLPNEQQMLFRVGINIGDVIQEGDQIYGDGVNIAARLQSLADAGGICISGSAYDQLKRKLALDYEFMGERTVKNISDPVRAYRIILEPTRTQPRDQAAVQAPPERGKKTGLIVAAVAVACIVAAAIGYLATRPGTRPADAPTGPPIEPTPRALISPVTPDESATPFVAVLPFVSVGGDSGQEYFADGLTEDFISGLGKVPKLSVIAPQSVMAYKGKAPDLRDVGRRLGVRYVLEGEVQKTASGIKVSSRLSDAADGTRLWEERYDRPLNDLSSALADIRNRIIQTVKVDLTESDKTRLKTLQSSPRTFEAYEKFLEGLGYFRKGTKDDNARAEELFEQAVALDPEYARAYAALARAHLTDARLGWSPTPLESFQKVAKFGRKAVALDSSLDIGLATLGAIQLRQRDYDKAIATLQQAVSVNQSGADAYATLALVMVYADRPDEAIQAILKAIRFNPIAPPRYLVTLGDAYRAAKRYDDAITAYRTALERQSDNAEALMGLAATYSLAGRDKEGRAIAAELLRLNPKFSLEMFQRSHPFKNRERLDQIVGALRNTGLK